MDRIEPRIHDEIKDYKEKFYSFTIRQWLFAILIVITVVPIYIFLNPILGSDLTGWIVIFIALPLGFFGFIPIQGLNAEKILDEFNEYLFEYTSRIPIKEIEKNIELSTKETEEKIASPYTLIKPKSKKGLYIVVYLIILILVVLTIIWSVNQITVDKKNAYVVSYRK